MTLLGLLKNKEGRKHTPCLSSFFIFAVQIYFAEVAAGAL